MISTDRYMKWMEWKPATKSCAKAISFLEGEENWPITYAANGLLKEFSVTNL